VLNGVWSNCHSSAVHDLYILYLFIYVFDLDLLGHNCNTSNVLYTLVKPETKSFRVSAKAVKGT